MLDAPTSEPKSNLHRKADGKIGCKADGSETAELVTTSEAMRRKIYRNTLFSLAAYHLQISVAYLGIVLGYGDYQYRSIHLIYALVLVAVGCFLEITRRMPEVTRRYADQLLVVQVTVWVSIYIFWVISVMDLRWTGLISATVVFTYVFAYGRLFFSMVLVFLFLCLHITSCYVAIYFLGQKGDMNFELYLVYQFLVVYFFLAFLGSRLVDRQQALVDAKQDLESSQADLHRAMEVLEEAANTDALTGLLNRRAINEKIRLEHQRCKRYASTLAIALIDLDRFKQINDKHGHDVGDSVLREVAKRFKSTVRVTDYVSRWGGEEFLILLTDTNLVSGKAVAEHLRHSLEREPIYCEGIEVDVTASIGLVHAGPTDDIALVIKKADVYLYQAKSLGRNRIQSEMLDSPGQ